MTKSRIGFWLLISLIPAGVWIFISIIGIFVTSDGAPIGEESKAYNFWAACLAIFPIYFILALITGIVLRVLHKREHHKQYREVRQYAELNGWQQISKTSWRTFKSGGTLLSVNQAFEKKTHLLTIKMEEETLVVEGFETSFLALQFGDWLWTQQSTLKTGLNIEVVRQQRTEWEQTRALAIDPRSRRI